jgi:tetratricopeptide (TPR) repeat protein
LDTTGSGKNIVAAVLVGVLALAPSLAHAQGTGTPPSPTGAAADSKGENAAGGDRFAAGKAKYGAGDYAGALADFQAADAAQPTSELAMYIGLSLDRLGRSAEAVAPYERFLAAPPAGMEPAAKQIGERLAVIKESLPPPAQEPTAPAAGPVEAVPPAGGEGPAPKPRSKIPAYVTGGVAVAAAGVGTIFGILFLSAKSDYETAPTSEKADTAEHRALAADIAFGAAITLGVASVLFFTAKDAAPSPAKSAPQSARIHAAPIVTMHGGGVSAELRF